MMSDELLDTICGVEPKKTLDAKAVSEAMRESMRLAIAQEEITNRRRADLFLPTVWVDRDWVVTRWNEPLQSTPRAGHPPRAPRSKTRLSQDHRKR
jgi:hypothetical protein